MTSSPLVAVLMLGVLGAILIYRGFAGDVKTTRLGDTLIPRCMYIVGGIALLVFPAVFFLIWSEAGRRFFGL